MKFLIVLALVAVAAALPGKYSGKFDKVNVDEIVQNKRLVESYVDCFNNEGKCTAEGKDLKEVIPEGVKNTCADCTEDEKPKIAKFIHAAQTHVPEKWQTLYKNNDPTGQRKGELDEFINKYGH